MPRYSSGTIRVTGTTVQGTNTAWDSEILVAGDILEVPLATAHIRLEVASVDYVAQTAVLEMAYAGPAISGAAYFVSPENAVQAIKTVAGRMTGLAGRYDNLSGLIDASGNIIVGDQFDLIQEAAGNADRAEVAALAALLADIQDTKADATTALGGYSEGDVILVNADETNGGAPMLYRVVSGALIEGYSPANYTQVAALDGRLGEINVYGARNTANATTAAALPDGSVSLIDGLFYETDTSSTGTSSATNDLGVDGLIPYGTVDVRHYGITPGVDKAAAWQRLVDNLPAVEQNYGSVGGYSSGGVEVNCPPNVGPYTIDTQVVIPANVSLVLRGQGGWGARFTGAPDHVFKVDASASGSFGWSEFDGISFDATGVEIAENRRGKTVVRRCTFVDAPNYGVFGNGVSIVGVVIEDNKFTGCAGGCSFLGLDVDLLEISRNDFVRGHTNPDLDLGCYSALVTFNDFETREVTSSSVPWIRLIRGGNKLIRNRFGDEIVGSTHAPPRDAIQIGPDTPDGVLVSDTEITGNVARGANTTPTANSAASLIRLNAPVANMRFADNIVAESADYFTALVHENYITAAPANAQKSHNNVARGNGGASSLTCPMFSAGGLGWDWQDRDLGSDRDVARQNMVRQSNDLTQSLWQKTNITAAKNAVGPDGVANSANTLSKGASGTSHMGTQLVGVGDNVDGNIVVPVWLKAGTIDRAQVYLVQTTNSRPLVNRKVINLTSEWKRHDVRFASIDSSKSYFLYIGPSGFTADDLAATGTILVYQPSAWNGYDAPDRPIPNIATGGTQHAAQQFNSLRVGDAVHGYGPAAPTTGRYEVGDVVWHTAPAASGNMGWVCVTAGSPGTWKTFGTIEV